MLLNDEENLLLANSTESVDSINKEFYEKFQYPWPPQSFDCPVDHCFETIMLNQSMGSWDQTAVPPEPKIWVAGCGTNQAIFTALRFPRASILGTDLSSKSLETSAQIAKQLNISNLTLKEESINNTRYEDEYDYIICTGVVHHNSDPKVPLRRLAVALKPTGVLEIMVYNRYRRILTSALQKAVRSFSSPNGGLDFASEMDIVTRLMNGWQSRNGMAEYLDSVRHLPESGLADAVLQPVEHSYTIESFNELSANCNLELLGPYISPQDKTRRSCLWNMEFNDPFLQSQYDTLPDLRRWQVTNLIMLEQSPMIWFYLQREDSPRRRKTEKELCEEFLELEFVKCETQKIKYDKTVENRYVLNSRPVPYPSPHTDDLCRKIIKLVETRSFKQMREIFQALGIKQEFSTVNKLRLALTTTAYPYLMASPQS